MSEKRYYIGNGENCTICDSSKGGSDFFNMLTQYQAVDELNALHEENEQLNKCRDELIRENRHIKGTIQSMLINERTMIGKSVLKQLWDAIH